MTDPYIEEEIAHYHSSLGKRVATLRANGEEHPVVLLLYMNSLYRSRFFAVLNLPEGQRDTVVSVVVPKEVGDAVLGVCVGPGVGTRLLGFQPTAPEDFYLVYVRREGLEVHTATYNDGEVHSLAVVRLDIERQLLLHYEDGRWVEGGPITW